VLTQRKILVTLTVYQTISVIGTFILGMISYPDVQKRAQAAIDAVVGNSRLPDFSDKGTIPYVDALVYESLRWNPMAPLGIFLTPAEFL
jgi:cytochrome P450